MWIICLKHQGWFAAKEFFYIKLSSAANYKGHFKGLEDSEMEGGSIRNQNQ